MLLSISHRVLCGCVTQTPRMETEGGTGLRESLGWDGHRTQVTRAVSWTDVTAIGLHAVHRTLTYACCFHHDEWPVILGNL